MTRRIDTNAGENRSHKKNGETKSFDPHKSIFLSLTSRSPAVHSQYHLPSTPARCLSSPVIVTISLSFCKRCDCDWEVSSCEIAFLNVGQDLPCLGEILNHGVENVFALKRSFPTSRLRVVMTTTTSACVLHTRFHSRQFCPMGCLLGKFLTMYRSGYRSCPLTMMTMHCIAFST